MAQGYWKKNMNRRAGFEMFFRSQPFGGGFAVFAGLGTLLENLASFTFSSDDLAYLASLGVFEDGFLDYLKDFRFSSSLCAKEEGTIVFPNEPLIRVDGGLIECQLLEEMLLNTVNFQSLIATKAARVWLASGKGAVLEFGLRRAQGPDGGVSASRAAFIGGAAGTSNVLAGKMFGMPVFGTMAHSWVMAWPNEEDAFRAYAEIYPDKTIFLIDTYDTLKSGVVNAIKVGKELAAKGKNFGVRLDSGDIHYLSVEVRKKLDAASLPDAFISVSNELDESIIQALTDAGAPINSWGVGTRMVTGGGDSAFTGVYKLAASEGPDGSLRAAMKFSDNPGKTTNPGIKQVWRVKDAEGMCLADVLALEESVDPDGSRINEKIEKGGTYTFWHPSADYRHFTHTVGGSAEPLLVRHLVNGKAERSESGLSEIHKRVENGLASFDQSYKRLLNPHIYKVSVTERLKELKLQQIKEHLGEL
jgi:nicotinate phosphoribosyltransferase